MATRILVTDGMDASAVEQLRKDGFEVVEQFYEPDELGTALRDFDAVIIRSATKIKAPQIDAAKGGNLKLIIRAGVGVDNIAVKYAEENGIQVKNTPRASSNAVAELALALLFSCARNISIAGHTMRENKWEKKAYSKGFELSGKTMGVIGYGRIGQLVGAKGQALGMNVLSVVHRNKPEGCEVINTHQGLDWLARHPEMLFPQNSAAAGRWFSIVQHRAQRIYAKAHNLDLIILGRRRADGNYVGRGTNIYTDGKGVTRFSPLAAWSHEHVLAYIHYHQLPLPPIYGWKNGYLCGTHPWPARQWTGSPENGWREVYDIDPSIVIEAAEKIGSARAFLEGVRV